MGALVNQIGVDAKEMFAGEFSEAVTIGFDDGTGIQVIPTTGIYDDTYEEIEPETGAIVMSSKPRVTIYVTDIETQIGREISNDVEENWIVSVRSKDHRIQSVQRDGTGVAMLQLKNA